MSYGQKALYFMYLNSPESSAYNVAFTVRIKSGLDTESFRRALQRLVSRHPVLRTNYTVKDGIPVQEVHGYKEAFMEVIDCPETDETKLKQKVLETSKIPFDLENGDVLKTYLFNVSDYDYVLLMSMHHIANDGFSLSILLSELKSLYQAETEGSRIILDSLTHKYTDYVDHQNGFVKSDEGEKQWTYWKDELSGELPVLNLPIDKPRPALQTFNGAVVYFNLEKNLVNQLKNLSKAEGTTLFVTLLSAYNAFLHRYTGQDELITGTPTAGRNRTEFEKIVGYFINPVAIKSSFSENPTFTELLKQARKKVIGAISNQDFPFALIVERMHQKRDPSRSAVFQTFFGLQKIHGDESIQELIVPGNKDAKAVWGPLSLEPFEISQQEGQFELTLEFVEGKDIFSGAFKYNADLFEKESIEQMKNHFLIFLSDVASNPGKRVSETKLMSDDEIDLIVDKWNDTDHTFDEFKCLHRLFEAQVERTPDNIAVVFEDKSLTYDELNRRSNILANRLKKFGVEPDILAGLCVERSLEMVIGILAVLKAGGAYIPIDPDYPQGRIDLMISDSKAKVLITQKNLADRLPGNLPEVFFIDDDLEASSEDEKNIESNTRLNDLAYVIYTSGSTGTPKGVMISHASIVNHMLWMKEVFGFDASDSVFQKTPFSFDASVWEFYLPLLTGGRLIMAKPGGHMDMPYLVKTIIKNNITILQLVPSLLKMLLDEKGIEKCLSLKTVFCGGEALTYDLQEKLFSKLNVEFYNLYGPTEATIDATYFKCGGDYKSKFFPIGKPVYNATAYILDKYQNPVPAGISGELYLGGVNIARGYLNNDELTRERFLVDAFRTAPGRKLYRTGDLATFTPDGNIQFVGREDHQIKLRGFRIELEEIEAVLSAHEKVKESIVIIREDEPGVRRLTAYVIFKDGQGAEAQELKDHLRKSLPLYMIPSDIMILLKMPLTPNLKIDRNALPVPEIPKLISENYVSPALPAETILADIWKKVLGIDRVGIHDNFFELGGDSIISIQIISRANQEGIKISPKQIFQYQTIAGLASVAEFESKKFTSQEMVTGSIPLTPVQHWFFEQGLAKPDHYSHSVLLSVPKDINEKDLEKAVDEMVRHHDALRMVFEEKNDEWVQSNKGFENTERFSVINFESENRIELNHDIDKLNESISLNDGTLIKVRLYKTKSDADNKLLIIIHHLCVDGISWRIFLEDLYSTYTQLTLSGNVKLNHKTTSLKEWSQKLNAFAGTPEFRKESDYWIKIADESFKHLPVDIQGNKSGNTVDSTETISIELEEESTQALLKEVPKAYNTHINEILLTAMILAFNKFSKENKLILNLEGHGREEMIEHADLSRTVGWFTSIFPVVLKIYDKDDIGEAIKSVKETLRQIPNNGIGFGMLKYLSNDIDIRNKLNSIHKPEFIFNYLGQFNENITPDSQWKFSDKAIVLRQGKKDIRASLLELNSLIINGKLKMELSYSKNFHEAETIEAFANDYMSELRKIITHCTADEGGGYTPSDFSASGLSQQELDNLLANTI
jgi:amino acid adenylation domain-containing protein/non-ribosomal peptide synthase protein (TIGR01720 family)